MIHVGVLRYANARYLWWAIGLVVISLLLYISHSGTQPANGGTWQGYVLGTIGGVLVTWLLLLGVRKRAYSSTAGTVAGWTSAHVYLGSALLIVATLHSAGQLGWNVHSLAYLLMCVVIFSGFYGVYAYINYPHAVSTNRSNAPRTALFAELYELDMRGRDLGARASDDINVAVKSAIEKTAIGGGLFAQLFGRDRSKFIVRSNQDGSTEAKLRSNVDQVGMIGLLAQRLPRTEKVAETELLQDLLEVFCRRQAILRRIAHDIRLRGRIRAWLLVHVPVSVALLFALAVHITTTFVYW